MARRHPLTIRMPGVDAMRPLVPGGPWGENVLKSLAWTAGILAALVPLSVKRHRAGAAG